MGDAATTAPSADTKIQQAAAETSQAIETMQAKQAADAGLTDLVKSVVGAAIQTLESKVSNPLELAMLQLVQKAVGSGLASSEAKAVVAALLAPLVNSLLSAALARFGVTYQVTPDQIAWAEGALVAYVLGRSWVKASLHKIAAELTKLGMAKAGSTIDSLAA